MRERPLPLILLSCFLLGCAISIPIQIGLLYGHGVTELPQLTLKISVANWLFILLCTFNAILLIEAHSLLKLSIPTLIAVTAWNNWFVAEYGQDYTHATTMYATLGFLAFHGLMFHPKALKVLLHPQNRWWRIPVRKQIPLDVTLFPFRGPQLKLQVYDISEGGTFIPQKNIQDAIEDHVGQNDSLRKNSDLKIGQRVQLKFKLGQLHMVSCTAKIVRKSAAKGDYPEGYGLCFEDLSKQDQRVLKNHLVKTPEMGNLWSMAQV